MARTDALKSAQARYKSKFKTLQIAVTPEQYEQLQNMAAAAHLSRTQFLLRAAEHYHQYLKEQEDADQEQQDNDQAQQ